jgi:branched-chain amino acid transport system permease protein
VKSGLSAAILVLVLAALPLFSGEYYVNLASQILIFAVFAASINLLLGYGGLATLGHAAYLGVSAYVSALLYLKLHFAYWASAPLALLATTLMAGLFGLIALRATGLGFLMLTLALSQVLWGTAYRWVSVTDGDNGLRGLARPSPFGLNLDGASAFYWFTLAISAIAIAFMARFVASPFGAALRGTRDQPRRMSALGYDVWLIRWITFVYAGFWGAVSGLLFVYYHKYIHPVSLSLANSAEGLLAVIAGGSGTLAGPLVGAAIVMLVKNYLSATIERWNMLLGFIFVFIVVLMPEGLGPGIRRYWRERARYRIGISFSLAPMVAALLLTLYFAAVGRQVAGWDFVFVRVLLVGCAVTVFVVLPLYNLLRRYLGMHVLWCVAGGALYALVALAVMRGFSYLSGQPGVNLGPLPVLLAVGAATGAAFWLIQRRLAAVPAGK